MDIPLYLVVRSPLLPFPPPCLKSISNDRPRDLEKHSYVLLGLEARNDQLKRDSTSRDACDMAMDFPLIALPV